MIKQQQLVFIEQLLCARVGCKALHVLTSTLTLQGGYHHYAHITKEETEVYKSSVACSESHSQ